MSADITRRNPAKQFESSRGSTGWLPLTNQGIPKTPARRNPIAPVAIMSGAGALWAASHALSLAIAPEIRTPTSALRRRRPLRVSTPRPTKTTPLSTKSPVAPLMVMTEG